MPASVWYLDAAKADDISFHEEFKAFNTLLGEILVVS